MKGTIAGIILGLYASLMPNTAFAEKIKPSQTKSRAVCSSEVKFPEYNIKNFVAEFGDERYLEDLTTQDVIATKIYDVALYNSKSVFYKRPKPSNVEDLENLLRSADFDIAVISDVEMEQKNPLAVIFRNGYVTYVRISSTIPNMPKSASSKYCFGYWNPKILFELIESLFLKYALDSGKEHSERKNPPILL